MKKVVLFVAVFTLVICIGYVIYSPAGYHWGSSRLVRKEYEAKVVCKQGEFAITSSTKFVANVYGPDYDLSPYDAEVRHHLGSLVSQVRDRAEEMFGSEAHCSTSIEAVDVHRGWGIGMGAASLNRK